MSAVRSSGSVEWLFGDLVNSFKFLDFKKKIKTTVEQYWENVCCFSSTQECPYLPIWK